MRLQRTKMREVKGTTYYKWRVDLPTKAVKELGWSAGTELSATVEDGRLVISGQPAKA